LRKVARRVCEAWVRWEVRMRWIRGEVVTGRLGAVVVVGELVELDSVGTAAEMGGMVPVTSAWTRTRVRREV
jgi:hypothetical protein